MWSGRSGVGTSTARTGVVVGWKMRVGFVAVVGCAACWLFVDALRRRAPSSPTSCPLTGCVDGMLHRLHARFESEGLDWPEVAAAAHRTLTPDATTGAELVEYPKASMASATGLSQPSLAAFSPPPSTLSPPPMPAPVLARRLMSTHSLPSPHTSCPSASAGERALVARQSRAYVARWQGHGICSGAGRSCRPLLDVVASGGPAEASLGTCEASRRCAGRGRLPRVYVHPCMDGAHERLLKSPHVSAFFDANAARNQYLSEFVMHRSLLLSPHRVLTPEAADIFFVPFYARLAYADKVASKAVRKLQANLTGTLETCLRTSDAWQRNKGKDHLVAISSTRDPKKLFGRTWPLLKRSLLVRIEAAPDRRYDRRAAARLPIGAGRRGEGTGGGGGAWRQRGRRLRRSRRIGGGDSGGDGGVGTGGSAPPLVLPYYVPNFPEDERVRADEKTRSVCFFGTATHPLRRQAVQALKHVEGATLSLGSKADFNSSGDARDGERQRTLSTRRQLRQCKLCLVPAGITPSSRRFYEALVAKCVPLLLSDAFRPAFADLIPLERYAVRAAQAEPTALPAIVAAALARWPRLFAGVEAVRHAFIYDMGWHTGAGDASGASAPCDAAHAILAEVQARFAHRAARERSRSECLEGSSSNCSD